MSKRDVTTEIVEKILLTAASGAAIGASLLLPGAGIGLLPVLEKAYKVYDRHQADREYRRIVAYMKRQELLKLEPRGGNGLIITEKGKQRAKQAMLHQLIIARPDHWDEQWRVVMFDIPEQYKAARNSLAMYLSRLGFYQLQKSVWVHPFPCRDAIESIALENDIAKYITFIEASRVDNEKDLRKQFSKLL